MTQKFEKDEYKIKAFEKNGLWHLVFWFENKVFMEFMHRDEAVIDHDFEIAKLKLI